MPVTFHWPAKITPPALPAVLNRQRLFRQLDQARKRGTVWISGPPGVGKTTLVASYLRARQLQTLWYQVDEGDADLATFFHYLGLACKKTAPRYRRSLPHLTPEYLPGLPTFTRRFFEQLYTRIKSPSVIVLDNYQDVARDSQLHGILKLGLEELPNGISFLVLSREDPPPELARLQASQQLETLSEERLLFTLEETHAMVRLYGYQKRQPISKALIEALYTKTQGWIAGLVLLLEQQKTLEGLEPFDLAHPPRVVFDYLAMEVMKTLDPMPQELLLKTAFLPSMTVRMACALTGLSAAGRILSWLYQTRYFTERRTETELVYQYHPLFREFLMTRAKETLSPALVQEIQRAAAALLEHEGRVEEAVALYQDAGQQQEVMRLICAQAPNLLVQGRSQTIEEWIHSLPEDVIAHTPWVLFWLGRCRFPYDPFEARFILERAVHLFRKAGEQAGLVLALSGVVEAIVYGWKNFGELAPWVDELSKLWDQHEEHWPEHIAIRVTGAMVLALMFWRPQDPMLDKWIDQTLSLFKKTGHAILGFPVSHIATFHQWRGEPLKGEEVVHLLKEKRDGSIGTPLFDLAFYLCEASTSWFAGKPEASIAAVQTGLELAERHGIPIFTEPFRSMSVFPLLFKGDVEGAEHVLQNKKEKMRNDVYLEMYEYYSHLSLIALWRKDLYQAKKNCEQATRIIQDIQCPFFDGVHKFLSNKEITKRLSGNCPWAKKLEKK